MATEEKGEETRGTEWKRIEKDWKGRAKKSMVMEKKREDWHRDGKDKNGAAMEEKGDGLRSWD